MVEIAGPRVGVVGLGYVGLTLAIWLAEHGEQVLGTDAQESIVSGLNRGEVHFTEPGLLDGLRRFRHRLTFADRLDESVDTVLLCVSTPVDLSTGQPQLDNLRSAAASVARSCRPGTTVIVRSTVPVGTTRSIVLPVLQAAWGDKVSLAVAPERTIQGIALRELAELPQVVGGLDPVSLDRAAQFFGRHSHEVVTVTTLETAELVKLSNNCHTDLLYSFGNEVALTAELHGVDPLEVIRATNLNYPRPDLARPGYVGGACLSKDPYLMLAGTGRPDRPNVVAAARALNEFLPLHVARTVLADQSLRNGGVLAVLGWAYKGSPPTDDVRGTPIASMMPHFTAAGVRVVGHDPLVSPAAVLGLGGEPVSVEEAFARADAVLVLTDHQRYAELELERLLVSSPARLVFDSWRILDEKVLRRLGINYRSIGYSAQAGAQ